MEVMILAVVLVIVAVPMILALQQFLLRDLVIVAHGGESLEVLPNLSAQHMLIVTVGEIRRKILDTDGEVLHGDLLSVELPNELVLASAHDREHDEGAEAGGQVEGDDVEAEVVAGDRPS